MSAHASDAAMPKNYHELVPARIYFGAAADVQQIVDEEKVEVVVDLREESTACATLADGLVWQRIPLADNAAEPQPELFKDAILAVVSAYRAGKKVAFHCGGGRGRTGTVAAGVLMELGLCASVPEAEAMAKAIRPVLNIKPDQHQALERLYPRK